jgi:TetR/AcrR family transcriptional regulator, repressor for uid operon
MCPKVTAEYKSEVREKIIESAVECFARTGFDRTKMDDISYAANVSKGTLYLYFKSKEDLFYGICQHSLEKIKKQLNGILIMKENLVTDAERFYDYFQKDVNRHHNIVSLEMIVEATRNPRLKKILIQHRLNQHHVISEFIELQIRKGFARKDIDKDTIASGLIGLYEGLAINEAIGTQDYNNKKAWTDTIRAIFMGIG